MAGVHRALALVFAVTFSSTSTPSHAQPATDSTTRAKALELFKSSDDHYRRGEFEQAAQLLRESYDLYPEPLILYNLGRALESMGDLPGAIEQYEKYLATATEIRDRGAIERRVATLKARLVAEQAAKTSPTTPETGASTPPIPERGETTSSSSGGRRWLPWVVTGVGVAVVGVGGVLGVMSDSRHEAAVDEPVQTEAGKLQDEARTLATAANVMFMVGGVITVGGAVWGVIQWRRGKRSEPARAGSSRVLVGPAYVGVEWTLP